MESATLLGLFEDLPALLAEEEVVVVVVLVVVVVVVFGWLSFFKAVFPLAVAPCAFLFFLLINCWLDAMRPFFTRDPVGVAWVLSLSSESNEANLESINAWALLDLVGVSTLGTLGALDLQDWLVSSFVAWSDDLYSEDNSNK